MDRRPLRALNIAEMKLMAVMHQPAHQLPQGIVLTCNLAIDLSYALLAPSANATEIVYLCKARPTEVIDFSKARLLCMKLGAEPFSATLDNLHTMRRFAPFSGEHLV